MKLLFQAIKPEDLKVEEILEEIVEAQEKEAKLIKGLFEQTVRTWRGKPIFLTKRIRVRGGIGIYVAPDFRTKNGKKFAWIDAGTSGPRRALMSQDFRPKTRARRLGSTGGHGGAVFVSRRVKQPGIKKREFSPEIQRRRERPFSYNMVRAINRGAKKAF